MPKFPALHHVRRYPASKYVAAATASSFLIALCCCGLSTHWAFAGQASRVTRRQHQRADKTALAAALTPGDTVMVFGRGGATEQITVSMLEAAGYKPRPFCNKQGYEAWRSVQVEGYILGGDEELPAAAGLVIADEASMDETVIGALVRRLSAAGALSRVAMLSNHKYKGGFDGLFSGSEDRNAAEDSLKKMCDDAVVEWTVVQTGTLRGGGPGTGSPHCLPKSFYEQFEDGALGPTAGLDEEVWDLTHKGCSFGEIGGGGFGNFGVPQTSRIAAATALITALASEDAARSVVGISSFEAKEQPSVSEFEAAFRS